MTNNIISEQVSTTGAASARLLRRADGRIVVQLSAPIGAGRRLRLDLGIGQTRATAEALVAILRDVDRVLYPLADRGENP